MKKGRCDIKLASVFEFNLHGDEKKWGKKKEQVVSDCKSKACDER